MADSIDVVAMVGNASMSKINAMIAMILVDTKELAYVGRESERFQ
jgi:2-methylaconitate cis-trans-isomerase PrpF